MKKQRAKIFVIIAFLFCIQSVWSQQLPAGAELESLLDKAELQSQNYGKVFRGLSAEELKTKIYYKSNGELDDKRLIKSLFIVYQSPAREQSVDEFRHVLEYNGKQVARDEKEVEKFFAKLAKADTPKEELEKLRKESLRYDGKRISWGVTLIQSRPFMKILRESFAFRVTGREKIEGRDVFVIEYEQTKSSPHILSNPTDAERSGGQWTIEYNMNLPDAFRPTNPRLKGKIWLDAETLQIWRNEFKVVLNPKNLSKPLETTEIFYEYQSSEFGILVPKKFSIRSFVIKGNSDADLSVVKDSESVFEYSKFSQYKSDAEYKSEKK